jgi:hypothetical protein
MSNTHTGNVIPEIAREEHARISGVDGKKVFNIDSDGNVLNFKEIAINDPLSAFGDVRSVEISPVFQGSFEYTVDNTEITTNTVTGSGAITQVTAMANVSTGTTAASTAKLQSKQHARYRSGFGGLLRFTGMFTSPVASTEQSIGS